MEFMLISSDKVSPELSLPMTLDSCINQMDQCTESDLHFMDTKILNLEKVVEGGTTLLDPVAIASKRQAASLTQIAITLNAVVAVG
jgi:hypothetical protein